MACDRNPGCSELDIALAMRRAAPHAYPNRRIVALADDMLNRRGRLVDAVAEAARADGARFVVAELPDDPAIGAVLALLRGHGFREEAHVPDYFRDGVALSVLRLGL